MIQDWQAEEIARKAKDLARAIKKYQERSGRYEKSPLTSSKAYQKRSCELATDAHHIETLEASLHATCVDAGIADLRDAKEYEEKHWWMSDYHQYRWQPQRPLKLLTV